MSRSVQSLQKNHEIFKMIRSVQSLEKNHEIFEMSRSVVHLSPNVARTFQEMLEFFKENVQNSLVFSGSLGKGDLTFGQ